MNIQYLKIPNLDSNRFNTVRKHTHLCSKSQHEKAYFNFSSASQKELSGTYVSQKNKTITILNEAGDEEVLSFITYDRIRFHLSLDEKMLVVWNYGQSPRKLISKLSELSDFSIVIDPLILEFDKINFWLNKTCDSVTPIKFTSQKITLKDYGSVKMEISPKNFDAYSSILKPESVSYLQEKIVSPPSI